jgi:pimeloyl-ACP methyl ester carboxylesterase
MNPSQKRQIARPGSAIARGCRIGIAVALGVIGMHAAFADSPATPLQMQIRAIALPDGQTVQVEAGELLVPESRAHATERRISIPYYRLRSTARSPATPIFMLAGGPGEPALELFEIDQGTREIALFLRSIADVVLLDQRGAGRSQPRLDCGQRIEWPLDQPLTREAHAAELRRQATLCRDQWLGKGVDLAAYTTIENASDVEALRAALGYQRMSLLAHSYGTHLALALLRHHSRSIERAILYGIEGPDHTYDLPSLTLETLGRIASSAERSPALAASIPEGGLIAALERVQQRLGASPVTVTVERGGRPVTITISRHDVQRIARLGSHDRTDLFWPAHVIRMHRGDFTQAAQAVLEAREEPIDSAMYFMMDCASGISPARRARLDHGLADVRAQEILGDINLAYNATCEVWHAPDLGAAFRSDVHSDVPVLFLQGTWDMSTAYVNATEVARGFPRGVVVTVEGGTHFVLQDLFESWAGTRKLLRDFYNSGRVSGPRRIVLADPAFALPDQR